MRLEKNGLMAFWSDIKPDYVLQFQEWHNCEHIPERISIPGFYRGSRYRASDGRPHFLMFYETESPDIMNSGPYIDALNSPSSWTKEALNYFRNPVRNIYQLVFSCGDEGSLVAPWLTSVRFNCSIGTDFSQMSNWIAAIVLQSDVYRARLFEVEKEISSIMTSERKIYGGVSGGQRYLAMIEHSVPSLQSNSLAKADTAISARTKWRQNECIRNYWLEISHSCHIDGGVRKKGEHS
ncbi:MAG: hypothetical protein GY770_30140 [Aestuariibacter sp.]|nr:hypothetical protein [Aestuariibacter sp.]